MMRLTKDMKCEFFIIGSKLEPILDFAPYIFGHSPTDAHSNRKLSRSAAFQSPTGTPAAAGAAMVFSMTTILKPVEPFAAAAATVVRLRTCDEPEERRGGCRRRKAEGRVMLPKLSLTGSKLATGEVG